MGLKGDFVANTLPEQRQPSIVITSFPLNSPPVQHVGHGLLFSIVAAMLTVAGCAPAPVPLSKAPPAKGATLKGQAAKPKVDPPETDLFAGLSSDFELDTKKQDEIWLAEHVTFELEQRFGKRFVAAWKACDEGQFLSLLLPGFQARRTSGTVQQLTHEFVSQASLTADGASEPVDVASWCDEMFEISREFQAFDWTTFRVLSINRQPEQPQRWTTRVLLGAAGADAKGKMLEISSEHDVVFEIPDDPKEVDRVPVLNSWSLAKKTVLAATQPLFREVTEESGLADVDIDDNWKLPADKAQQYRFQMAVEDFDQDGWLDLAVAEQHRSRLLRWNPEQRRFEDVTTQMGLMSIHLMFGKPVSLAGWVDYDNDGFPDLLLGNRLYHNDAGRRFTDVTAKSGLTFQRQGTGVLIADYDADGLLDIYLLYQASIDSERPKGKLRWIGEVTYGEKNRLWRNLGNGKFEDVTDAAFAGAGKRHHLAGTFFHYDDDHFPDIYTANDLSANVLLRNRGNGTFEDVSTSSGSTAFTTSMGVAAGDTDNNGTSDLYIANMFSKMGRRIIGQVCAADYPERVFEQIQGSCAGNQMYRRDPGSLRFHLCPEQLGVHSVGWAYAPALADFDNDGWLDIYATTGFLSFERGKPDG